MKNLVKLVILSDSFGLCVASADYRDSEVVAYNPVAGSKVPGGVSPVFDLSGYSSRLIIKPSSDFVSCNIDVKGFKKNSFGEFEFSDPETLIDFLRAVGNENLDNSKIKAFINLIFREKETATDFHVLPFFPSLRDSLIDSGKFPVFAESVAKKEGNYVITEENLREVALGDFVASEEDKVALDSLADALGFKSLFGSKVYVA